MLKTFSLVALAVGGSAKELPDRLLIAPWGETQTRKGRVVVNGTTLAQLSENQRESKFDRVAFDFNHNTLTGQEPVKIAGTGVPEVVEGEGIYLSAIEYTEDGKAHLPGGHYPDISPAVVRNEQGEVVLVHSVAACRQGEIDGLTLFSADKLKGLVTAFSADAGGDAAGDSKELKPLLVGLLKALDADLSVEATATDDELAGAVSGLIDRIKSGKVEIEVEKETSADPEPTAFSAVLARLDKLEADRSRDAKQSLVAQATAAGKVVPFSAAELDKMDVTLIRGMIDKLPVSVPLESRTGGVVDDFSATGDVVTPEQMHIRKLLGR